MKRLNVIIQCMAVYNSGIDVPDDMTLEDTMDYAEEHIDEIPLTVMDYIYGSDMLDREGCDFEEETDEN